MNEERSRTISDEVDRLLIAHIYCIILYYIPHLSCNKSAKFLVLNVYFTEDNHGKKEDKNK